MKILVVDDEHSFGSLLGRALKKLGHKPALAAHPEDALELFGRQTFDAVITDIDMPVMSGVELAQRLRELRADIPIAFCTGSELDDKVVRNAEQIGRVLPKVWTVADVKDVVTELDSARKRLARGSQQDLPNHDDAGADGCDVTTDDVTDDRPKRRRVPRKIKITCRDWEQVAKLCREQSDGKQLLSIRGKHRLRAGERLFVALRLPDELVLSIAAEVHATRTDPASGEQVFSIALVGLTPEICARLRSMAQSAGAPTGGRTYARKRTPRGTEPPRPASPGQVIGNLRLRKQIDELGKKLKN
jgi:CheY-like chemotaxis protein